MDWQDTLVARLTDRIVHHDLLVDLEPYRRQLEFAAVEHPVDRAALEADQYRLWRLWHEGFARHAAVLDAEIREHLTTDHLARLGDRLVAVVPAARFGANPPARVVWVLLTAIQRYEIAGEAPPPPSPLRQGPRPSVQ